MDESKTEDLAFGEDVWIYCKPHMRAHQTGWCTVPKDNKVPLVATNRDDAIAECRSRGFALFEDKS